MITLVSSNFVFGVLKLCNSSFLFKIGFTQLLDTCLKFDVEVSISCVYPAVQTNPKSENRFVANVDNKRRVVTRLEISKVTKGDFTEIAAFIT